VRDGGGGGHRASVVVDEDDERVGDVRRRPPSVGHGWRRAAGGGRLRHLRPVASGQRSVVGVGSVGRQRATGGGRSERSGGGARVVCGSEHGKEKKGSRMIF
jgi:hypothetical protein